MGYPFEYELDQDDKGFFIVEGEWDLEPTGFDDYDGSPTGHNMVFAKVTVARYDDAKEDWGPNLPEADTQAWFKANQAGIEQRIHDDAEAAAEQAAEDAYDRR